MKKVEDVLNEIRSWLTERNYVVTNLPPGVHDGGLPDVRLHIQAATLKGATSDSLLTLLITPTSVEVWRLAEPYNFHRWSRVRMRQYINADELVHALELETKVSFGMWE